MATWIPNQPVIFGEEENNCSCDVQGGAQLCDNTDVTQFQFEIDHCAGAEDFISDPEFNDEDEWELGNNWSVGYNQLCLEAGSIVGTYASSQAVFVGDHYYKVTVIVDSISGGSIDVVFQDIVGNTVVLGTVEAPGTYTFYGFADTAIAGNSTLSITNNDIDVSCCISSITAFEVLTDFKFVIKDSVNNSYKAQISYLTTPSYFTFSKNTVTVTVNWAELGVSNGCYYVCLLDPCVNTNGQNIPATITNPNFTNNANGWTLGASWTYNSNAVDWVGFIIPANNQLRQTIFPTYSSFTVTLVIPSITGTLAVYFGDTLVQTISTSGTHIVTGIVSGNLDLILQPSAVGGGTLDSVTYNAPAFYEYTCDSQSNTFKLASYSALCTILVNACNDSDGMGFVFDNSGFTPRVRLEAKLKQPKYTNERNIYEDSAGEKKTVYYKRRKAKYFCVDLQPEYIHDFLSLLVGFDNVYLNNVTYFAEDEEYQVEYSEASDNLGSAKLLVSERVQNVVNNNCSDSSNTCNLNDQGIIRVFLDNVLVETRISNDLDAEIVNIIWN